MKLFLIYFLISGLIMLSWFYYDFNYSETKDESNDEIGKVTWSTGISRENVRLFLYVSAILFGWIMLPYEVVERIKGE